MRMISLVMPAVCFMLRLNRKINPSSTGFAWGLFQPDHHGIGAAERFDAGFLEAGIAHPAAAIGAREIKPGLGLDQHVKAHEQAEGVPPAIVINDRLINDERAALG